MIKMIEGKPYPKNTGIKDNPLTKANIKASTRTPARRPPSTTRWNHDGFVGCPWHPQVVWRRRGPPRVDLDAIPGSILALLGENGAGKSTLVRILAGDYVPDAGKIQVGDQSFARLTLPIA